MAAKEGKTTFRGFHAGFALKHLSFCSKASQLSPRFAQASGKRDTPFPPF
jgi:hypothetical protein